MGDAITAPMMTRELTFAGNKSNEACQPDHILMCSPSSPAADIRMWTLQADLASRHAVLHRDSPLTNSCSMRCRASLQGCTKINKQRAHASQLCLQSHLLPDMLATGTSGSHTAMEESLQRNGSACVSTPEPGRTS